MGVQVDRLVGLKIAQNRFDLSFAEIRDAQILAMNERLYERIGAIKLLALRAEEADITRIDRLEDVVPLLLPHTAYKSYPESFLREKRWDRLTKWLGTVSTYPIDNVVLEGIVDIDEWVARLAKAGHFLSCSSGTTGNPAMLMNSRADVEFAATDVVEAVLWGSDMAPVADRTMANLGLITITPRGTAMGGNLFATFADTGRERISLSVPPLTVGSITKMIALRKAVADGTAKPAEIAEYEAESAARQTVVNEAFGKAAEMLIERRNEKLYISGYWGQLYQVAEEIRSRGYGGKDFNPENSAYLAGGLKKSQLPPNYREVVFDTFNISSRFAYHMYGMQEIQSSMPRCQKGGRYHVPPWLVCLPLDKDGEALLPGLDASDFRGEVEGRAAFFDLSLDGRWGGIISGDHIHVDYGRCACGATAPSIRDDIRRYSDIQGDDKIACSGTIDAYVRGLT
jgi:hypothetical protein